MSILSSGAFCDVCDKYILPLVDKEGKSEMVNTFRIKGIVKELHCHNDCKKLLQSIGGDWEKLPDGNIRRAFEEHEKKAIKKAEDERGGTK